MAVTSSTSADPPPGAAIGPAAMPRSALFFFGRPIELQHRGLRFVPDAVLYVANFVGEEDAPAYF